MRIEISDGIHVTVREQGRIYLLGEAHIGTVVTDDQHGVLVSEALVRGRVTDVQYADGIDVLRAVAGHLGVPFRERLTNEALRCLPKPA